MESYNDIFNSLISEYEAKSNTQQSSVELDNFCSSCNCNKIIEASGFYTCEKCGHVSSSPVLYLDKSLNISKIHRYDRRVQFRRRIYKNYLLDGKLCLRLTNLFNMIQAPYEKYKGNRRKFLMTNYVLRKLLEYMGLDKLAYKFPLPVTNKTQCEYNIIWDKIVSQFLSCQ